MSTNGSVRVGRTLDTQSGGEPPVSACVVVHRRHTNVPGNHYFVQNSVLSKVVISRDRVPKPVEMLYYNHKHQTIKFV